MNTGKPAWRALIRPGISTLLMLAVLLGLGAWQVRRLHWKQGVLQAIATAEASPPVPLSSHPGRFQKVAVRGVLRADRFLIYGADVQDTPSGPRMGGQLIQPLQPNAGPPVLVVRGWVPDGFDVQAATPSVPLDAAGYVRFAEQKSPFIPSDDPIQHRVYTLNPPRMAALLGLRWVAPFTVVALGVARPGVFPMPAEALPRPPNDHLSYAITWFTLAAMLAGVFGIWAAKALRAEVPAGPTRQVERS